MLSLSYIDSQSVCAIITADFELRPQKRRNVFELNESPANVVDGDEYFCGHGIVVFRGAAFKRVVIVIRARIIVSMSVRQRD